MARVNLTTMTFGRFLRNGDLPVSLPGWLKKFVFEGYPTDIARMRLAIELSRLNVEKGTGGPFGAVLFNMKTGDLIGVGVNRVVPTNDPSAHAEVVASRVAGAFTGNFSLREAGIEAGLYTSAQPCGMCLTETLWSGAVRLFYAARTSDVEKIGFDEGVRSPDWRRQYTTRGIRIRTLLRPEAVRVLHLYRKSDGKIYNG